MRSTPRSASNTISSVTGTVPPNGPHNPPAGQHPQDPTGGWQTPAAPDHAGYPTPPYPDSTPPGYSVSAPPGYPVSPHPYTHPGQQYPMTPAIPVVLVQAAKPPASSWAMASFVLSIIGLVLVCCSFGLPSALAVIFGHMGLTDTKDDRMSGRGLAVAGLTMGYIGVIPAVLFSIGYVGERMDQ